HHEPLERVTDDEDFTGDMLKDAMMQERIAGWIHEDERVTSLLEVEPTPEVHVGSLQHTLAHPSDFERITDSEDQIAPAAKTPRVDQPAVSSAPELTDGSETPESATPEIVPEVAPEATAESDEHLTEAQHQAVTQPMGDQHATLQEPPLVNWPEEIEAH